jgi:chitinase
MGTAFGEDVQAMQQQAGLKAITLAFLVGASDGSCAVGWGGYAPNVLPNDTLWNGTTVQSIVAAMQKTNVQVIVSFGGSSGADPAYNCAKQKKTAATLQALYQSVINRYKVTMLDFDIEPVSATVNPETDQASLTLRAKALAGLKAANPGLVISYTLPVTVAGLDATGMNVISSAKTDGLTINTVNIMAMDYGKGADDGGDMGQAAVSAATHTKANIAAAFPNATIGITPMIGETVVSFAEGTGSSYISRIGMWSLNRDSGCAANASAAPTTCSGISQTTNQFSELFNAVH